MLRSLPLTKLRGFLKRVVDVCSCIGSAAKIGVISVIAVSVFDIERTAKVVAGIELDFQAVFLFHEDVEFAAHRAVVENGLGLRLVFSYAEALS